MNATPDIITIDHTLNQYYGMNVFADTFEKKQQLAFDKNMKYYFSTDESFIDDENNVKTVKRYKGFNTLNEFFDIYDKIPPYERHYYEMITGECVEYYDIDGYYTDEIYIGKSSEQIISDFLYVRKLFLNEKIFNLSTSRNETFYISTSSNDTKVSFHITVRNGFKFKNVLEHKSYIQAFLSFISENNYQVKFDKSIYTPNRNIRIVGSTKHGSDRVFVKLDDKLPDVCFLASYTTKELYVERTDGKQMVVDKKIISIPIKRNSTTELDKTMVDKAMEPGELANLINLIIESVNAGKHSLCDTEIKNRCCYDDWKKIAFAIIRITNGDCQAEFKAVFDLYRHSDDQSWFAMYENMKKYVYYGWTSKSLHYWAKENPRYDSIFQRQSLLRNFDSLKKKNENFIIKTESKEYNDFDDFNVFVNTISSQKAIEKCLKETIVEIQNYGKKSFFMIKFQDYNHDIKEYFENFKADVKQIECLKKITYVFNDNYENELDKYFQQLENKDKRVKKIELPKMIIQKYIYHPIFDNIFSDMYKCNKFQRATEIVNEPYFLKEPDYAKGKFNIFRGFTLLINNPYFDKKETYFESTHTYKHMKDQLFPGDSTFEYVMKYIADLIQNPGVAPDVAILLYSLQGNAKDLCVYRFISMLIGDKYTVNFGTISDFFSNFTSSQEGKLLTVLNEIADGPGNNLMYSKAGEMKDKVTRLKVKVEKKGIDPYYVKHTSRYFLFTNHERAIAMDNSDRRHLCIKCKNDYANNLDYMNLIVKEMQDPNFIKSAFSFFANMDISDFNPRKLPVTEYKDQIKILNMNSTCRFLMEMYDEYDITERIYIQQNDIYELYKMYCKKNGYSDRGKKTFVEQCKPILGESRSRKYNQKELSMDSKHLELFYIVNNQGYNEKPICDGLKKREGWDFEKDGSNQNLKRHLQVTDLHF